MEQKNLFQKITIGKVPKVQLSQLNYCIYYYIAMITSDHQNPKHYSTSIEHFKFLQGPSHKFCHRTSNSDRFFCVFFFLFVYEGREDPNATLSRPSSALQRNTIWMELRWCADVGPTWNAGLVALWFFRGSRPVLLRNPIFLWFFRGVGTICPPPPLDPRMVLLFCDCDVLISSKLCATWLD